MEVAIDENNWEDWGQETQWKRRGERTVGWNVGGSPNGRRKREEKLGRLGVENPMEEARRENRWVICAREPQCKKKKGRKVGIFRGGKPNGSTGKKKPLGDMCEGAPMEEEKGKKSWDIWG